MSSIEDAGQCFIQSSGSSGVGSVGNGVGSVGSGDDDDGGGGGGGVRLTLYLSMGQHGGGSVNNDSYELENGLF